MPRYRVELLDPETKDLMDVVEFNAANDHDAKDEAAVSAETFGYVAGTVTRIAGENK